MDTKLREMPPLFDGFFSPLACSSVLRLWGFAILCLESLETLVLSPLRSFPDIAQFIVSPGLLLTLPKVPLFRLFSMMLDEMGWKVSLSPIEGSGEDSTGSWRILDRDFPQTSLVETEFYVITLSPICLRVSPEELGKPTMVSVPEMWVTGEKKAQSEADSVIGLFHL